MVIESMLTFILASLLICIAPGPDNLFVLTQSALYGRKTGVLVTLGLCSGLLVHTTFVALGGAVIFQASQIGFSVLKVVGAMYLLYLAWLAFTSSVFEVASPNAIVRSAKAFYIRGVIMNLTNPKVSIFFLAFLPQFTQPENGGLIEQLFILGAVFILVALLIFSSIALLAGSLGDWLAHSPKGQVLLNRVAGMVFVGLALKLAISDVGS